MAVLAVELAGLAEHNAIAAVGTAEEIVVLSAGFTRNIKKKSKRRWRDMIIKIEAVPKLVVEDGVEKVVMGENNQPVWDRERDVYKRQE